MFIRFFIILLLAMLVPGADAAFCHPKPLTLQLAYTTRYNGLRIAVPSLSRTMPKLGIALAGGGAKAAAAIGVLKVLDKEGIPVSFIAGTSMGAGVGGFYAAGYRPDEIEQIFGANDWNSIFTDTPSRAFQTQEQKEAGSRYLLEFTFYRGRFMPPAGLTAGQKLMNFLAANTLAASFEADLNFNKLKVPFRAIATDIETGDAVVLDHGLLHEAIRASAAIPLVFQPVELQGRLLVDGGLSNNLPVSVVRGMGADIVIAIDSSTQLEKKEKLTSLLEIMGQSISLRVRRDSEREAALADVVITPDTALYSFTDFPSMPEIVRQGEEAARAALPRIREILRAKTSTPNNAEHFRITTLSVRGSENISEATIRYALSPVLFPREAGVDDIFAAMEEVSRLGYFHNIAIELEREGSGARAVLTVEENPVVKTIAISGNTLIPTADILSALSWQYGRPLNATRLSTVLDAIVQKCRGRGYLLTRVERAGMKPDDSTLEIVFYEGRVDAITLEGQRKTQRSLIRRETVTRPGTPLNFDAAANDIQHLYALNYFESLGVGIAKSPQGGVDLTLAIKEKPTTKVRLGLRYDLEDRFTGLTDVIEDNVLGRGIKTYLTTRYGNYTDITAGYHSPVLIDTNFVHTVQTFYRQRNYYLFEDKHRVNDLNITRTGVEIAFGYQWFRFGDTYLRYRYATDKAQEALGINPVMDVARIGSIAFLTTLDTRDKNVFPHTGMLFKGSYDAAREAYGSSKPFTRTSVFLQANLPLAERHTLVLEGSGGLGSGTLPYQEKFGIGGADYLLGTPLLGYQRREFVGSDELGFSASYRWRIKEYQLKAIKAVYLNVAGQAANVWDARDEMGIDHLRNGAGIGLHADTIIGPVRFDYAVGEQHRRTVYFSAGFDF